MDKRKEFDDSVCLISHLSKLFNPLVGYFSCIFSCVFFLVGLQLLNLIFIYPKKLVSDHWTVAQNITSTNFAYSPSLIMLASSIIILICLYIKIWHFILRRRLGASQTIFSELSNLVSKTILFHPVKNRFVQVLFWATIIILLGLPSVFGAVIWTQIFIFASFYPNLKRGSKFVALSLVGISLLYFFEFLDILTEGKFYANEIHLGSLFVLLICSATLGFLRAFRKQRKQSAILLLPAIFPFFLLFFDPTNINDFFMVGGILTGLGVIVCPLLVLFIVFFKVRNAEKRLDHFLNYQFSEFENILKRDAPGHKENFSIIESDGWAKIIRPYYFNRKDYPNRCGETGYIGLISLPSPCVCFRTTSLVDSPFTEGRDEYSKLFGNLCKQLIPKIPVKGRPQLYIEAIRHCWSVKRFSSENQFPIPLVKLPWDHPDIYYIPETTVMTDVCFPEGSGIYSSRADSVGAKVSFQVSLKEDVLNEIARIELIESGVKNDLGNPFESNSEILRSLLWNVWRIYPAIYETIHMGLVDNGKMNTYLDSLKLHTIKPDTIATNGCCATLQCFFDQYFPAELNSIVTVKILNVEWRESIVGARLIEASRAYHLESSSVSFRKDMDEVYTNCYNKCALLVNGRSFERNGVRQFLNEIQNRWLTEKNTFTQSDFLIWLKSIDKRSEGNQTPEKITLSEYLTELKCELLDGIETAAAHIRGNLANNNFGQQALFLKTTKSAEITLADLITLREKALKNSVHSMDVLIDRVGQIEVGKLNDNQADHV